MGRAGRKSRRAARAQAKAHVSWHLAARFRLLYYAMRPETEMHLMLNYLLSAVIFVCIVVVLVVLWKREHPKKD
jgi:hypothetical protein